MKPIGQQLSVVEVWDRLARKALDGSMQEGPCKEITILTNNSLYDTSSDYLPFDDKYKLTSTIKYRINQLSEGTGEVSYYFGPIRKSDRCNCDSCMTIKGKSNIEIASAYVIRAAFTRQQAQKIRENR